MPCLSQSPSLRQYQASRTEDQPAHRHTQEKQEVKEFFYEKNRPKNEEGKGLVVKDYLPCFLHVNEQSWATV